MNNLEKYLDQVIEQKPVVYEPPGEVPPPPEQMPTVNLLASVRRRWYIVLAVTIVLSALALPAIWLVIEPQYVVQGAVKVRQVIPGILTPESSAARDIGTYGEFVNTEAILLLSNNEALQQIADQLSGQKLTFFSGAPQRPLDKLVTLVMPRRRNASAEKILRDAIARKKITATAIPRTELLAVAMRGSQIEDAKTIVNTFLTNYAARFSTEAGKDETTNLGLLDRQRVELEDRIKRHREEIRKLAEPYGTPTLGPQQKMEFDVQTRLMGELITLQTQKIAAEANVSAVKEMGKVELPAEEAVSRRRAYVNSDPMFSELTRTIVGMERDLTTEQSRIKDHPRLTQEQAALESLKAKLLTRRQELEQEYDTTLEARQKEEAKLRVAAAEMELRRIQGYYKQIESVVGKQEDKAKQVGGADMSIQELQFQLQVDQEQHDTLYRRIQNLLIEKGRLPRVQMAYAAELVETNDRRPQLAMAAVVGALACGFGLAFLRDRVDKTLQTAEDVARQLDLPVLGTTTSSHAIKPALLAEQIAGDYQTIRTNLGLAYDGGLPRKLVVSSAGTREGKTTFAVNLATSLAKSGKKVLLIDGDLRKPDVGHMLNVPKDMAHLQDVLLGEGSSHLIYVSPASGLHVLAANPLHMADPYELLTSAMAAEQIERLAREYDHIVIDSPPALAFPDALVWAKLADAVVLVSYAGQTTVPDLREAKERFARGRARVLGAVLSNVPLDQSLYRHAYTYRARGAASARKTKKLLLAAQPPKPGNNGGGDA